MKFFGEFCVLWPETVI